MKNFVLGLVGGIVLAGVLVVFLIFAAFRFASSLGARTPTVADGSTLIFKLEGSVPEKAPTVIPLPLFEQESALTIENCWDIFHRAAADPKIKAILFEPRGLSVGWAGLEELREEMAVFRKSGKPLAAFLRNPGAREYYLAAGADRIYMTPEDELDLKGLRAESMYFKNTLDKFGLRVDVIHAGKYKDAGDAYTQTGMSPETREVLNDVLNQDYGDLVSAISVGRKKTPDEVRSLIDQGPFLGSDAVKDGLVDELAYEDQIGGALAKRLNQSELKKVSERNYLKAAGASGGQRLALIVGEGDITRGPATGTSVGQGIVSGKFIKLLQDAGNDSSIKGVILRINSPGGDGIASDDILQAAKNLSHKKPLVISMSDLAASGGYYISMTGDPIVAYPNTLTGSIGVIFARLNVHGLFDKLGINVDALQRGRYAGLDSSYAPLSDDDRQKITTQIFDFYKGFVSRVAQGRKRPFDQIEPLAQGRVWLGAQAKQNGLVDELGGLDRAIEMVKKRANIGAGEKITLVTYPPRRSLLDLIMSRNDESPAIDIAARKFLGGLPVRSLLQGGFMKLMPYTISVR